MCSVVMRQGYGEGMSHPLFILFHSVLISGGPASTGFRWIAQYV